MKCVLQHYLHKHWSEIKTRKPKVIIRYIRMRYHIQVSQEVLEYRIRSIAQSKKQFLNPSH